MGLRYRPSQIARTHVPPAGLDPSNLEESLAASGEARILIESKGRFIGSPAREHDLVTASLPGGLQCKLQEGGPHAPIPVSGISDYILDDGKGPCAPGQIGDDNQHASGGDKVVDLDDCDHRH